MTDYEKAFAATELMTRAHYRWLDMQEEAEEQLFHVFRADTLLNLGTFDFPRQAIAAIGNLETYQGEELYVSSDKDGEGLFYVAKWDWELGRYLTLRSHYDIQQ